MVNNKLNFSYDEAKDVLKIEGVNYSGAIFRQVGGAFPIDRKFSITKRTIDIAPNGENNTIVEIYCFADMEN